MNLTYECTNQVINVTRRCLNNLSAEQTDFVIAGCLVILIILLALFIHFVIPKWFKGKR